jgi:hypothetical protein
VAVARVHENFRKIIGGLCATDPWPQQAGRNAHKMENSFHHCLLVSDLASNKGATSFLSQYA